MSKGAMRKTQSNEVMIDSFEEETQPQGGEFKDASPSQQEEDIGKVVNEDKKKPVQRRSGKRKRATNKETEKGHDDVKKYAPREKKARPTKVEPEYLEEKRNLEDLWKAAFPVGTEWEVLDKLYDFNWDFKHLEEALEEGGMLYGKKVFVFVNTEPQWISYKGGPSHVVYLPTVFAIESPFPPSDKLAVTSVQSATENIIPMKQMKMEWVPYIPFEKRDRHIDRMKCEIFILACTQRRSALKHLKEERFKKFNYCLPYFYDPFKGDELENSTEVKLVFPSEEPVVCEFDWSFDRLEAFADYMIDIEEVSAEQKDEFKVFVKEHVRAERRTRQEAKAARLKAIEEMSEETKQAFQSIRCYKFYPQPSPDISGVIQSTKINRYYGHAHQVL
ncbi:unnamed protein product [Eruca vesicaria subsp. sativa]|uniref:Protein HEAT INTOLERANT 4 n=1 Tax=Eruca vesicaria subsp. sativa TaxID=29727 RepID=A0ABC8JS19_ERUVS|nr:unnamed protein product [Eruca vesicaria subsp. sativa]